MFKLAGSLRHPKLYWIIYYKDRKDALNEWFTKQSYWRLSKRAQTKTRSKITATATLLLFSKTEMLQTKQLLLSFFVIVFPLHFTNKKTWTIYIIESLQSLRINQEKQPVQTFARPHNLYLIRKRTSSHKRPSCKNRKQLIYIKELSSSSSSSSL